MMVVVHDLLSTGISNFVSNATKTRLLFICYKKDSGFGYPHDRADWAILESLQAVKVSICHANFHFCFNNFDGSLHKNEIYSYIINTKFYYGSPWISSFFLSLALFCN
ncbi:UNVERIFIED_CONTAM: hypothetical protein NCL1_41242 [Trichonephila clavipes]